MNEYEKQVLNTLNTFDNLPKDIIEDINLRQDYLISSINHMFKMGYSIKDAARSIFWTSDTHNEDYAIKIQNEIINKYQVN